MLQIRLNRVLTSHIKKRAKYVNAYEQKMQMTREVIELTKAIWDAQKRYILNSHDIEGVRPTKNLN